MHYLTLTSSNLLSDAIARLRSLSQLDILPYWQIYQADISLSEVLGNLAPWNCDRPSVEKLNAKGHIPWPKGQKVLWLVQKIIVPDTLQNYPLTGLSLRLALTWWAEFAQIFVNGELIQEGDLFDCSTRILLSTQVTPNQEIIVALRLVSPSHDHGALVKSQLIYQSNDEEIPEPSFVADELAILQQYLTTIGSKSPVEIDVTLDWSALPNKAKFEQSLLQLRSRMQNFSQEIKQRQIYLVGHAHLDLAWLWAISETWEVAKRTFMSVLQLQAEYPQLTFCHSTPAIYSYIEQHCPELFAAIQNQVTAGSWEVVGALWVEPELNLIDGESIVRQLLYGQRYVLEKFGFISTVAWLPDTFGFCATLPQIFASGGIEYFVTQKLRWNDTTQFPHDVFWWRSPDGTQLFSLMSAPIGEGIDPVKMTAFSYNYEKQTNSRSSMWLPGVGDHGGGPTRDMLELAKRWQSSPLFPTAKFATTERYLQDIQSSTFPIWDDELYLEFHRGCYTTHADQKRLNRRCEALLYQAELFASLATISANLTYPKAEIEAAWKKTLINQFHDILPGSSIPQVYEDANADWQEVQQVTKELVQKSLKAIASQITLPSPPQKDSIPIVVFNALNWETSQVVEISLPTPGQKWHVYNHCGEKLFTQLTSESTLLFLAKKVSSVGYSLFWLSDATAETIENTLKIPGLTLTGNNIAHHSILNLPENCLSNQTNSLEPKDWVLENELLRVIVDSNSGDLASVFDKINNREFLHKSGGNQLQAYKDSGQYWDAWNIDPNYQQFPLQASQLKSIQWLEKGAIQTRLRVVRQIGISEFCCDYILQKDSPLLKIATTVDFKEREVLVKAAFSFNEIETDSATYEIPFGAISRPTKPITPRQQAKWEVPALRWADLSNQSYGVSLLNDCKYGYDSKPNQLRLTLLRSASWPDPEADKGYHEFTYAMYPHAGNWQAAHTVRHGYELNVPMQVIQLPATSSSKSGTLPTVGSFLNLSADNLVITAFKQSQDNPTHWILRCYECHGLVAEKVSLQSVLGLKVSQQVDILERPTQTSCDIMPWKIANFVLLAPKRDRID